jgi:perosamine synthetase
LPSPKIILQSKMDRIVYSEWQLNEYRDCLACLRRGAKDHGPELPEMLAAFGRIYPESSLFSVNRGRFGLRVALRVFARIAPHRNEVIYPAYVCSSVIEMIEEAGLVPVPADIGTDLNLGLADVERAHSAKTLAVIAAHIYGCPAPVGALEELCRQRGIFLVDDAANIVGVKTDAGRMLGAFGDVGLLSFTASKSIVAGGYNAGGLLLVNNPKIAEQISREWALLPEPEFGISDLASFFWRHQLEPYTRRVSYYLAALRRKVFNAPEGHACPAARMPNISAALVMRQLQSLPERIAGRIRVAELYHRATAECAGVRFPQYQSGRLLTRVVLLLPEGCEVRAVRAALAARGIETRSGYALDLRYGCTFPRAAQIAPRLLEVPSHSRMSEPAVQRICASLGEVLDGVAVERGLIQSPI